MINFNQNIKKNLHEDNDDGAFADDFLVYINTRLFLVQ
jgi:hypothetical protein